MLLPDGFTADEKEKFLASCQAWQDALFGYAPFDTNKQRINIRAVWAPSAESGISIPGKGEWKKTLLDCRFYTFGSERYQMTEEFQTVRDIANRTHTVKRTENSFFMVIPPYKSQIRYCTAKTAAAPIAVVSHRYLLYAPRSKGRSPTSLPV